LELATRTHTTHPRGFSHSPDSPTPPPSIWACLLTLQHLEPATPDPRPPTLNTPGAGIVAPLFLRSNAYYFPCVGSPAQGNYASSTVFFFFFFAPNFALRSTDPAGGFSVSVVVGSGCGGG